VTTRLKIVALGLIVLLPGAPRAETPMANHYLPADRLPWYQEAPSVPVKLAPLWGDRAKGEAGTLLNAPAGFKSGLHSHTADYWAVVVEGTWEHWVPSTGEGKGIRLTPGAHWTQIRTQWHEDACVSSTPCTIFLFNKDPYITEFPKTSLSRTFDQMTWRKQAPDLPIMISELWGDRARDGGYGELVQVPPGFDSRLHAHTADFHGVLVKGTWVHVDESGKGSNVPLKPGSYIRQAGGGMHVDRCVSKEPCVLFLFQDSRADVLWPNDRK